MDDAVTSAREGGDAFERLNAQAQKAGASIAAALSTGQVEGRKLEDVLRSVGARLGDVALQTAGRSLAGSLSTTLARTLVSTVSGVSGGVSTLAAPAALSGLSDVVGGLKPSTQQTPSSAQNARPLAVTMNISSPDAESFRRSEAQVSAALARAVQRGQRGL
jgi:hypothetical protein